MKDKPEFVRLMKAMTRQQECKEAELQKLTQDPDLYSVAQAIADSLISDLEYLCHFTHMLDGHGNRVEVAEVQQKLKDTVAATFRKITGKDYEPTIVRAIKFRKEREG